MSTSDDIDLTDYDARADQWDAQYRKEYAEWLRTLSPVQLAKMRRHDLHRPAPSSDRVGGRSPEEDRDPADSVAASYLPDMATEVDLPEEELAEQFDLSLPQARALSAYMRERDQATAMRRDAFLLQRIVGVLIGHANVKVAAAGLAFATRLNVVNGMGTLRAWSEANGVSAASVSKAQIYWREILELPASPHGKSDAARAALSRAQKEKHWRKRKHTTTTTTDEQTNHHHVPQQNEETRPGPEEDPRPEEPGEVSESGFGTGVPGAPAGE